MKRKTYDLAGDITVNERIASTKINVNEASIVVVSGQYHEFTTTWWEKLLTNKKDYKIYHGTVILGGQMHKLDFGIVKMLKERYDIDVEKDFLVK